MTAATYPPGESRQRRYQRRLRERGLCRASAKHGPSAKGGLCAACYAKDNGPESAGDRKRRVVKCTRCREPGHNVLTCLRKSPLPAEHPPPDDEVRAAAEVAVALTPWDGSVATFPRWLYDAVARELPVHLGYGWVEGVLLQRGPFSRGGFRFAEEGEIGLDVPPGCPAYVDLDVLYPTLARARQERILRESLRAQGE